MIKQIRYIFEALFLVLLFGFSKILPVQMASDFGGFVGRTIGIRLAASRKALRNAKMVFPNKSDAEIKNIIIGMWDNLGRVMMEYAHLKQIVKRHVDVSGIENLDTDKGGIIISAHLANWEIVPPFLYTHYNQNNFVPIYRAPNNPYSDYILKKLRSFNGKLDSIPKSKSGTRKIVASINDGKQIGMIIDQKYNEGIEVDFLGTPAMTSPIFAQLALKYNCPIVPAHVVRVKGANFKLNLLPPMIIKNKTAEQIVKDSHLLLQQWIEQNPEQWLWIHNRWNNNKHKLPEKEKP